MLQQQARRDDDSKKSHPALVIKIACPAVRPAQHNCEHPEGHDEGCHEKHFSSRHDLLPLLLLPAVTLPESRSVALIEIKSRETVDWDSAATGPAF